jgi:hypothetical protein
MQKLRETVVRDDWSVGTEHRFGDNFITLHVYKLRPMPHRMPRFEVQRGDSYGMQFPVGDAGRAAMEAHCLERGYTKPAQRNNVEFISSRAFRKHTGRTAIDPDNCFWQLRVRHAALRRFVA